MGIIQRMFRNLARQSVRAPWSETEEIVNFDAAEGSRKGRYSSFRTSAVGLPRPRRRRRRARHRVGRVRVLLSTQRGRDGRQCLSAAGSSCHWLFVAEGPTIRTPPVRTPPHDSGTLPGSSGRCRASHRRSITTEEKVAITCGADARRWRGLRHMLDTAGV